MKIQNVFNREPKLVHSYNAAVESSAAGGLAISEDVDEVEDREVNFVISRNHDGCDIVFNQIPSVYASVMDKVCAYNSGIIVNSVDRDAFADDIKYLESKREELELERHITTCLTNRELYGCGAMGLKLIGNTLKYLVDINTKDNSDDSTYKFRLIVNSLTGRLGIAELDPDDMEKVVVAVQKGEIITYNNEGDPDPATTPKIIYFNKDDIMILGNYELGRVRGQSPVMRILRYAEAQLRLENTILLLSKRPTQLVYIAGNEKHNLLNCEVPQSYMEAAGGDRVKAKIKYKTDRLSDLNTEAKKLADGNVLAQVLEYGTDLKSVEVPEGLPYMDYVLWFSQNIRMGITGEQKLDKRVVRSREQEAKLRAELLNRTKREQKQMRAWLNNNLTEKLLKGKDATINDVWYDFDTTYTEDRDKIARVWVDVSQAMRNLAQANVEIPDNLMKFMEEQGGSKYTSKGK